MVGTKKLKPTIDGPIIKDPQTLGGKRSPVSVAGISPDFRFPFSSLNKSQMSAPVNFLASAPNGDFKLRHWRSPAFLRERDPAAPAAIDVLPPANSDLEFSNWSPDSNIREGYTSIRDLIDSSPRSCVASPTSVGSEIQIRNPLVKQAVYAYLQLTPSCTESTSSSSRWSLPLRRLLAAISAAFRPLRRCFGIIARLLCCASSGDLR